MLTFKLNINRQTFNNNIASAEKPPIFKSHKSYKNSLANIKKIELTSTKKLKLNYILGYIFSLFLIIGCNYKNKKPNESYQLKIDSTGIKTINKIDFKDSLVHLQNSIEKNFSDTNTKDKFTISIIGENILKGEMVFKIINSDGNEIFNERNPSNDLINGYIFDEKSTSKELEEYIKKRVSEFFEENNFLTPALSKDAEFDADYSNIKIWTDIKSDSTAVGFYYLIGLENGCRIAYSKKQKKVLKYFCCC